MLASEENATAEKKPQSLCSHGVSSLFGREWSLIKTEQSKRTKSIRVEPWGGYIVDRFIRESSSDKMIYGAKIYVSMEGKEKTMQNL